MSALTYVPGHPDTALASNDQAGCWHSRAISSRLCILSSPTTTQKKEGRSKSCPGYSYLKHTRPAWSVH